MFRRWIASQDMGSVSSYGDRSAMRASPAGLLDRTLDQALDMTRLVAMVTHDQPG